LLTEKTIVGRKGHEVQDTAEIRPFRLEVPQADLDAVQDRLARTRFTADLPDAGWDYGVPVSEVRRLVEHWRTRYDWRRFEARLNAQPQFTTTIDGQNVHFLHVRSARPNPLPLILTHGWPGSIAEFLPMIELLRENYDLVIPSLPGFGLSGPTGQKGWGPRRIATAWAELMRRLGYDRYGAVGNDWGTFVSFELSRIAPRAVVGVHVTQIFSGPSSDPADLEGLTEDEQGALADAAWFEAHVGGYHVVQGQQPQTLAHALSDSPAGFLGWVSQLYRGQLDADFILNNLMLYWLTGTVASGMRIYYEYEHATPAVEPTTVPVGFAQFANDTRPIRRFVERDHPNLVSWNVYDCGGHWAGHQEPVLLAADIQKFFEGLVQ
jgi:pimeloyl-ACP methyl ester carboxylesterase